MRARRRAGEIIIHPWHLGIEPCEIGDLHGGDCAANAAILTGVLDGSIRGGKRDIVLLNAAAGFMITGLAHDMHAGVAPWQMEQIDSGPRPGKTSGVAELQLTVGFAGKCSTQYFAAVGGHAEIEVGVAEFRAIADFATVHGCIFRPGHRA